MPNCILSFYLQIPQSIRFLEFTQISGLISHLFNLLSQIVTGFPVNDWSKHLVTVNHIKHALFVLHSYPIHCLISTWSFSNPSSTAFCCIGVRVYNPLFGRSSLVLHVHFGSGKFHENISQQTRTHTHIRTYTHTHTRARAEAQLLTCIFDYWMSFLHIFIVLFYHKKVFNRRSAMGALCPHGHIRPPDLLCSGQMSN